MAYRPGGADPAYPAYLTGLALALTCCAAAAVMNVLVAKCKVGQTGDTRICGCEHLRG